VHFFGHSCPDPLQQRLANDGFTYHTLASDLPPEAYFAHLHDVDCDVLILDDYHIASMQWQTLSPLSCIKVVLDDNHLQTSFCADIVVNPLPNVSPQRYAGLCQAADFCLGPAYTLLRREFRIQSLPDINARQQCLVTLGGADPLGLTYPLIEHLITHHTDLSVTVVVGSLASHDQDALYNLTANTPRLTLLANVQNMAQVMAQAKLAIATASGTLGELAAMGVPTLALVTVDNQAPVLASRYAGAWHEVLDLRAGLFESGSDKRLASRTLNKIILNKIDDYIDTHWHNTCLPMKLEEKSTIARQLIDGDGAMRVAQTIAQALRNKQEQ
jgi:spore coat polysaccharide biosynthesis predicted glycosyltransferase SpsG